MIISHKDFKNLDDNVVLWKYMSLSKFLFLVKTQALYLCRVDCFEDTHEGSLSLLDKKMFHYTDDANAYEYWEREKTRHYACCWIKSDYELNLMWDSYGKDGVAIKTTVGRLKECMKHDQVHNLYLYDVRYIDDTLDSSHEPGDELNILRLLFTKRRFFEQEKEVRLLYSDYENDKKKAKGVTLNIDLSKLIDSIFISPTADKYLQTLVSDEIKKMGLNVDVINSSI